MASTSVIVDMDENLKRQAETLFDEIGMSMSTAFTVFAKAAVRQQKFPFELEADPFYSEINKERLLRGIAALNAGKGVEHELIEDEDE